MRLRLLLVLGLILGLVPVGIVPAGATSLPGLAIDDPADHTPHIPTTGTIRGMAEVGNTIVVGGAFGAINKNEVLTRTNIAAFDATTGEVVTAFAPTLNGEVYDVVAVPGEDAVVVAGFFTEVNGQSRRYLVKLLMDGTIDPTFTTDADRPVYAAELAGDTIYLGGNFRAVGGQTRNRLAAIDARTGALVDDFRFAVDVPRSNPDNAGFLHVFDLSVSDDGTRVVAIGNFTKVADVDTDNTVQPFQDRTQVAVIDNAVSPPRIDDDWRTRSYEPPCVLDHRYTMYVRDVDVSADASYFVITTAGYYGEGESTCDTAARFDLFETGQDIKPTWVSYSGGDSLLQAYADGGIVYVGGHPRWANNPFGRDFASAGAVEREVAYAVDARNGMPLRWHPKIEMRDPQNPGRRGYGIEAFLKTDEGLWVGSDMRFAYDEYHNKIMLFPIGAPPADPVPASLPAVAQVVKTDGSVVEVDFDGTTATSLGTITPDPRVPWGSVRSSFRMGERLYTFTTDAKLTRYDDGGGAGTVVDLEGIDTISNRTKDGRTHVRWLLQDTRGSTIDPVTGRIYFTMRNDSRLYWRAWTPDIDLAGGQRFTASSASEFSFNDVNGMFLSGSHLYVSRGNGDLDRITMADGVPVSGSRTTVSGPGLDGVNWSGRALHLQSDASTTQPNLPPDVSFTVTCDAGGDCTFDASATVDQDGTVTSYEWYVDNVLVGTGKVLAHTIATEGSHEVRLVATDDDGDASLGTQQVTTTADPIADIQVSCDQLSCTFDASGSTDGGEPVVSAGWDFGDQTTGSGMTVVHDYAAEGNYDVTLTVTDDEGATDEATTTVTVVAPEGEIGFRAVANTNVWSQNPTVTIPAETLPGDTLLLYASVADPDMLAGSPSNGGWQLLGSRAVSRHESHVWWRVADGDDAGTDVTVPLSSGRKTDLTLAVYEDANAVAPVAGWASVAETVTRPDHLSPEVTTTTDTMVVSFWAQKSSNTTDWTAPAGQTVRSESIGSGGGKISTLLTDGGTIEPAGTVGGLTATADEAALTATAWTVALSKTDTSDEVAFTGSDSDNRWTATPTVTVPASTAPGDLLILMASVSWLDVTADQPTGVTGWTRLDQQGDGVETTIWWKPAAAADIGSDVTVPLDRGKKVDLSIVSYANVDTVNPFVAQQAVLEDVVRADHTTPTLSIAEPGLVVSYWADKSDATTDWVQPAGETVRVESTGVGGGRVGVLVTDIGTVSPAGSVGGLTATADSANDSGLQWTLVLRPA